jgi:hypothetical protein
MLLPLFGKPTIYNVDYELFQNFKILEAQRQVNLIVFYTVIWFQYLCLEMKVILQKIVYHLNQINMF